MAILNLVNCHPLCLNQHPYQVVGKQKKDGKMSFIQHGHAQTLKKEFRVLPKGFKLRTFRLITSLDSLPLRCRRFMGDLALKLHGVPCDKDRNAYTVAQNVDRFITCDEGEMVHL